MFVKGNMKFVLRDDLQGCPVSTNATFTLLKELGICDASVLEERSVNVGTAEVWARFVLFFFYEKNIF